MQARSLKPDLRTGGIDALGGERVSVHAPAFVLLVSLPFDTHIARQLGSHSTNNGNTHSIRDAS